MSETTAKTALPTTLTHLLGQSVRLMQPARGYRAGMDAALLAAAVAALASERRAASALELGCGVGGALLSLKARAPHLTLTGIEREHDHAGLAAHNVALNGFEDVRIITGDIAGGFKAFGLNRCDIVFCNPPYFDDPNALRAPDENKRAAWMADDGLQAWLDFATAAVRDGGHIVFIHRADRLADLLGGLTRCGSFMIRPILPFADSDAKRVIVRAQRLGKAPLRLLAPLVLHDGGERQHTDTVEAILRGEAEFSW
ncbi:methyltransferase [Asticcacaulis sp. EMRT-3]|uniref:tRNA1(Val) (adenine(37)-N6)-methyltransferase n=1 Tax=Asticcacaulis sp. EMRT-3 TaxID=3040349 RepID=UPI0024AEA806|nr:methyltransferase [Asticcacaulis sp. EMRT-3]MDI7775234.1 methyltransferase [Asticcacaulis sp. EMRT-3]